MESSWATRHPGHRPWPSALPPRELVLTNLVGWISSPPTELTGSTATQADAAALAAVPGGTVDRASAENPSDTSGAAYEVHVTKSDGTRVVVLEDSGLEVLSVNASKGGRH